MLINIICVLYSVSALVCIRILMLSGCSSVAIVPPSTVRTYYTLFSVNRRHVFYIIYPVIEPRIIRRLLYYCSYYYSRPPCILRGNKNYSVNDTTRTFLF